MHAYSSSLVSGSSAHVSCTVHGLVYVLGSVSVNVCSMVPKFRRLNVCVMRARALIGWPMVSTRVKPLMLTVSTTSVSPSHRPTDSPNHDGGRSLGNGRPSVGRGWTIG